MGLKKQGFCLNISLYKLTISTTLMRMSERRLLQFILVDEIRIRRLKIRRYDSFEVPYFRTRRVIVARALLLYPPPPNNEE